MGGNSGSWCPCAMINRGEGDRKCLGEILQAESTCGVCHALNLQRSFGNHWRIFKTAARYNDPIYGPEGSSAAFRITQHAGEMIGIEGAVIPAFTWAGGVTVERTIMRYTRWFWTLLNLSPLVNERNPQRKLVKEWKEFSFTTCVTRRRGEESHLLCVY